MAIKKLFYRLSEAGQFGPLDSRQLLPRATFHMILNDQVFSELSGILQESEEAISSHWQVELEGFRYDQGSFKGVKVHGHTAEAGLVRQLKQYALLTPFRRMGSRFPKFGEFYRAGKEIAKRRGGVVDLGMMRQVLTLSMLDQHISNDQARFPTVVIGDGWGTMVFLILSCRPHSKVVLVNLTSMLLVDLVYIRRSFPKVGICLARNAEEYVTALDCDKVGVVSVRTDDSKIIRHGATGTTINIASMQEMDPPVIASYFESFRSSQNAKTLFYCCNKVEKQLPGGTEISFEDYPWEQADNVLVDEDCPWLRYYLRFKPPFRGNYDGQAWHRLAELNKAIGVS